VTDWVATFKSQLRTRAEQWAAKTSLPFYRSLGKSPTILFERTSDGSRHGNFFDSTWKAINAEPDWCTRLKKAHPQAAALPERYRAQAAELDSSNSSDALLMNCFCPPGAAKRIALTLGLSSAESRPEFGYNPCLPLIVGKFDSTEIDMRMGDALFEAKLTERDFTSHPKSHLIRYTQLEECFNLALLPRTLEMFAGYQLIRNVLAAANEQVRLVVLIDRRRPDLLQQWWNVHGAIKNDKLRNRCDVHFWQEIAAACNASHRQFLEDKYGL
jgi:hypothetical protein